jgi:probable HAF family extracellular repeat protein
LERSAGAGATRVRLNDEGQIVGWSRINGGAIRAFLWQNGRMRSLGTLGAKTSRAFDINNRHQIVGTVGESGRNQHAVLWTLKRS